MLILSRHAEETVGAEIARAELEKLLRDPTFEKLRIDCQVLEIRGAQSVRLGFSAPKQVEIHRGEIWAEKARLARLAK